MTTVTNITELNAAFVSAAGLTTGTFTITLGNDISYLGNTRLKAINLQPGVTLVIEGDGHTLNGGGVQRGLSGSVAQINAVLGVANNVLYHSAFDVSGVEHLTMTSSDGSLSDTYVLDLSVVQHPPMAADFWLV